MVNNQLGADGSVLDFGDPFLISRAGTYANLLVLLGVPPDFALVFPSELVRFLEEELTSLCLLDDCFLRSRRSLDFWVAEVVRVFFPSGTLVFVPNLPNNLLT